VVDCIYWTNAKHYEKSSSQTGLNYVKFGLKMKKFQAVQSSLVTFICKLCEFISSIRWKDLKNTSISRP